MSSSRAPNSVVSDSPHGLVPRLAIAIFLAALAYDVAALVRFPDFPAVIEGLAFPLRLFLIAVAPTIAGIALLWSDRAIGDELRKRLMRILVLALCGYASLVAVSGLRW